MGRHAGWFVWSMILVLGGCIAGDLVLHDDDAADDDGTDDDAADDDGTDDDAVDDDVGDDDVGDDDGGDDDVGDDDGGDDDSGDDDGGDDDVGDDDVGDDDVGDDDGGDDDTGANPLIGSIYVQQGGIGLASYHFDASNNVYINYSNAPGNWLLDNGAPFPSHKPFVNVAFDVPQRTFEGTIDWSTPENTTVGGARTWQYVMIFSPDYAVISGGTVKMYSANGTLLDTLYYGADLFYQRY